MPMNKLPITDPTTRTEGLKNFVANIFNTLNEGNKEEALLQLNDLWNDIGGAYKCLENPYGETSASSPVPEYNPAEGNYEEWLVANNID